MYQHCPSNLGQVSFDLAPSRPGGGEHDSALLAAECAGIAARALKAMGKADEAEERRERAEAGFSQLGATSLLERLQQGLRD